MARRRKKSKAAAAAKAREKEQSMVDKSLPALPPNIGGATPSSAGSYPPERVAPDTDTPTELSPRPRQSQTMADSTRRVQSPEAKAEGLGIPPQSYRKNRNSAIIETNSRDDADSFFIPVALDPSPGPSNGTSRGSDTKEDPGKKSDYFGAGRSSSSAEKRNDSAVSTPHIAFQEKRTHSAEHDPRNSAGKLKQSDLSKSASSPAAVDGRTQHSHDSARDSKGRLSESQSLSPQARSSASGIPSSKTTDAVGAVATDQRRESNDSRLKDDEERRSSPDVNKPGQKPIQRKELSASAVRNGNTCSSTTLHISAC